MIRPSSETPDQSPERRVFLFLQGPHGPFFFQLGRRLRQAGSEIWRVGFNMGDSVFWPHRRSYIPFRADQRDWPGFFADLIAEKGVEKKGSTYQ